MNKIKASHILLLSIVAINTVLFFSLDFISALEKTDFDISFYTQELQDFILNKQTTLMFPLNRVFVPGLSILISKVLFISYKHSMQLISVVSLIGLIGYIKHHYRNAGDKWIYISIILLSVPVIMLYTYTYFVDIPLFAVALIMFWQWDLYCQNKKSGNLIAVLILAFIGMLIKEALLVHIFILGVYTILFYKSNIRRLLPVYFAILFMCILLFIVNYYLLFDMKSHLILNHSGKTAGNLNLGFLSLSQIVNYLKNNLVLMLRNLLLALGLTHFLIIQIMVNKKDLRKRYLLFFITLLATLTFITMQISPLQRYSLLCFVPSIIVLLAKNIPSTLDKNTIQMLMVNYMVNSVFIGSYVVTKNSLF